GDPRGSPCSVLEVQGGLGAGLHRPPDPVRELRRHLARRDVEDVLVVDVEGLRHQPGAHGVGLAQVAIDRDPHPSIVSRCRADHHERTWPWLTPPPPGRGRPGRCRTSSGARPRRPPASCRPRRGSPCTGRRPRTPRPARCWRSAPTAGSPRSTWRRRPARPARWGSRWATTPARRRTSRAGSTTTRAWSTPAPGGWTPCRTRGRPLVTPAWRTT